jgi:hypothetical protein
MDELEIDGKKYLSSRRAAKEHKYHTDYIGQLIRAGKVDGKKVGRAWYVEEGSLNAYLKSEGQTMASPIAPVAYTPPPVQQPEEKEVIQETKETVPEIIPVTKEEPTPVPIHIEEKPVEEKVFQYAAPVQEKSEQKIHITLAERDVPQRKNTLTYIEDTEPLLPVLEGRSRSNADFVPLRRMHNEPEEMVQEETIEEEVREVRKLKMPRYARASMLGAVAIIVLAVVAGLSSMLATSIQVKDGEPASVALTIK